MSFVQEIGKRFFNFLPQYHEAEGFLLGLVYLLLLINIDVFRIGVFNAINSGVSPELGALFIFWIAGLVLSMYHVAVIAKKHKKVSTFLGLFTAAQYLLLTGIGTSYYLLETASPIIIIPSFYFFFQGIFVVVLIKERDPSKILLERETHFTTLLLSSVTLFFIFYFLTFLTNLHWVEILFITSSLTLIVMHSSQHIIHGPPKKYP